MRIIRTLLVLAMIIAVVGYFRGWFSFSSFGPDSVSGKVNVNLTIDSEKMKNDADKVKDKTTEITDKAATEIKEIGDHSKERLNPNDP